MTRWAKFEKRGLRELKVQYAVNYVLFESLNGNN